MSTPNHPASRRLCFVTAADIEFNHIARVLPDALIGRELGLRLCRANFSGGLGKRPITVLQSEMGAPDFATRLRNHLSVFPCESLLIIGLAGGLSAHQKTGDIVIYERCDVATAFKAVAKKPTARDEIVSIASDNNLVNKIEQALSVRRLPHKRGIGSLTANVLTQATEKTALHTMTGADAVDMESWLVMDALRDLNIPVAACRVIVDEAGDDLPAFNNGLRADGYYDAMKMLRVMSARPVMSTRFLWNLLRATHSLRRLTRALCET